MEWLFHLEAWSPGRAVSYVLVDKEHITAGGVRYYRHGIEVTPTLDVSEESMANVVLQTLLSGTRQFTLLE